MKEIELRPSQKIRTGVLRNSKHLGVACLSRFARLYGIHKIIGNVEEYLKNDHFVLLEKRVMAGLFYSEKTSSKVVLTKAEHETEVKNPKELEQALFLMGYQISTRVI